MVSQPRETDLTVMFCDLRGFSRQSERDSGQLLELLQRVSDALGIMTRSILDTGGVIGDFHGDAAMGFWGWPLDQSDSALRASEAALKIQAQYAETLADHRFGCGIGIASGRAVAGQIGTVDQVKVTAFGPVVNLASRLEGITKAFGTNVILDQGTADAVRNAQVGDGEFRLRRLAKVRPAGFGRAVTIRELICRGASNTQTLTPSQVAEYETALDDLLEGNWQAARQRLTGLPDWDRPRSALLTLIEQSAGCPSADWQGVIDLPKL